MFHRNCDVALARQVADLFTARKRSARMRRELDGTSDRALAELGLARGEIGDVVAGSYRRAA